MLKINKKGGEIKGNKQEMWRIGHYMMKVKFKSNILAVKAQEDKGVILFKIFDNTCKGS